MTIEASTPVLVGVGVIQQKLEDVRAAKEPVGLMVDAVRAAATDAAGSRAGELLAAAQRISVPKGMWNYTNPAGLVAEAVGASAATTVLADIGILQQTLLGEACGRIASGELHTAIVVGGEAKYRQLRGQIDGVEVDETAQDQAPDVYLQPEAELYLDAEINSGLGYMPVNYYAMMESAFRHAQGWTVDEHRDRLARMYSAWSEISETNPHAWKPGRIAAEKIRNPGPKNPMLAFPYTRLHNTSWNVDQASCLVFCSAERAEELGVPREQWVFPLASTESNFMLCASQKEHLHELPGARIAGAQALRSSGLSVDDLDLLELYSCFPVAIEIYARELGLPGDRPWTVTGGMPFAGGPLNNFVFQSTCRMAELLRQNPDKNGLVTSVSGLLTKQGFGVWSGSPPVRPFTFADLTEDVRQVTQAREVVDSWEGPAAVAGCTVVYQQGEPWRAIAILDIEDGRRAVAWSENASIISDITRTEWVGRQVMVAGTEFTV